MNEEKGPHYEMPENFSVEGFESAKSGKHRIIIPIAIAAVLVAAVILIFVKLIKSDNNSEDDSKIFLITKEDLRIDYFGFTGTGTLGVAVDFENIQSEIYKAMGYSGDVPLAVRKEVENICIHCYIGVYDIETGKSINGTLCNGQRVILKLDSLDDESEDDVNEEIVFNFNPVEITLDGFEEPEEKNIFDDIIITVTGEDGSATINLEYTGDLNTIDESGFRIVNNGKLSYGTDVKIMMTSNLIRELSYYGIIPNPEYIMYTVE